MTTFKSDYIADCLQKGNDVKAKDPLVIAPMPDISQMLRQRSASVDLRLGTWFVNLRQARIPCLYISNKSKVSGSTNITKTRYVPFGEEYYLHPGSFVLGITMEWIRMPSNLSAYVIGKSSLGRRGLIIATAIGVHPGYIGCLTLELSNVGEIPIALSPGMKVCQLFIERAKGKSRDEMKTESSFTGNRKPTLGKLELDSIALNLVDAYTPKSTILIKTL